MSKKSNSIMNTFCSVLSKLNNCAQQLKSYIMHQSKKMLFFFLCRLMSYIMHQIESPRPQRSMELFNRYLYSLPTNYGHSTKDI